MSSKKIQRPRSTHPKSKLIRAHVDQVIVSKLDARTNKQFTTRSDIIRKGIFAPIKKEAANPPTRTATSCTQSLEKADCINYPTMCRNLIQAL
ncbi:hypothetical protein ACSE3M_17690 [Bacillus velezensis]|uniref:hypothetical protein n=1 Tax=Bacillus velezensis TaxID=492670 RepID=UPI002415C1B1|nr:hypothetical protein [Bacillus velezensis]